MQIIVNGQTHESPDGETISRLLESLGLDPARVAVELDGTIVRQPQWTSRVLADGSRLEIVHFVGGG